MAHALNRNDVGPIIEMNMTPLIDVLLVLLVMFIITIPLQSHAVKLDLPSGPPVPRELVSPIRNEVAITESGQILWNASSVTKPQLASLLARSQDIRPIPELHLKPEPEARYDLVDEVLALTKRAHVQNMGFVGNEAYAGF